MTLPSIALRLITLDLDDTLWPCAPVIQGAEEAVFAWLARETPRIVEHHDILSLRSHRIGLARENPHIAHDFTAVRLLSLRALLHEHGYAVSRAEEVMAVFHQARNAVMPFPEVTGVLQGLRSRYQLISLTNGNANVACTPLRDCFHHSLTAADVGAQKPHPALFLAALEHSGTPPEQAVHVGDDPELDVEAARQVGLRTVWVNRSGQDWPAHLPRPDLEIAALDQLAQWVS